MEDLKEKVQLKLKELEQAEQNAIASVNAIRGAKQVLLDLLKEEKPKENV